MIIGYYRGGVCLVCVLINCHLYCLYRLQFAVKKVVVVEEDVMAKEKNVVTSCKSKIAGSDSGPHCPCRVQCTETY